MVEHIGAASAIQSGQLVKSAEAAKTQEVSEKKTPVVQEDESRKYDRYEFSDEYLSASSAKSADGIKARNTSENEPSAAQSNELSNNEKLLKSSEETASQKGNSSSQGVSEDDSEESVDTNQLYKYTDSELKDFLLDGSITQNEYNAEIAKREN